MIGHVVAVGVKELHVLWQDRPALALLFLMPAFFIVVMSLALENVFEAGTEARPIEILVVDQDHGPLAARLLEVLADTDGLRAVTAIDGIPLGVDDAEALVRDRRHALALLLPGGLSDGPADAPRSVSLIVDPAANRQLVAPVRGAIEGAMRGLLLIERMPRELRGALEAWAAEEGAAAPPGDMLDAIEGAIAGRLDTVDPAAGIDVRTGFPRGMDTVRTPSATQQAVPAYTIFGVFFITLTLATSVVRERSDGTMTRLLASPLSTPALLLGKLAPYYLVNLVQIAVMFAAGALLFNLTLGDPLALVAVSLALATTAVALGLVIAAFGRSEAQVGALAVSSSITLAALGGLMVPSFVMPGTMQTLALATPHAWALAGYHDVMLRGAGIDAVATEVGALLAFALALFGLAALRFRFR